MRIGVIGATGNIGQRIVAEARNRGHEVVAFSRNKSGFPDNEERLVWREVDVCNVDSVVGAIRDLDVLVNSFGPASAARDLKNAIKVALAQPQVFVTVAMTLVEALNSARPGLRLIVVGAAGSLEVKPGLQLCDTPDFAKTLAENGTPPEYRNVSVAHRGALDVYRRSNRNWTYFSPAHLIRPGERTGRFRLGGNQMIVDANGQSRISIEDYALALVDEIEVPRHVQRRFTIGY
jgi:uncharacterized protein